MNALHIPYVIDNHNHRMAEVLGGVLSRNSDGNPNSPQVVVFLATIVDVTVGS